MVVCLKGLLRLLAFLIDVLLVFFVATIFLQFFLRVESPKVLDVGSQVFYLLYATITGSAFQGKSVGKFLSRQRVVYMNEQHDALLVGLRELPKLLYFLPMVGVVFLGVTAILYVIKGQTLHDLIGGSRVVMDREYEAMIKK